MELELSEKQLIYILNCLSYTSYKLTNHPTLQEKKEISSYFNLYNYYEDFDNIKILYNWLSLKGNKAFYNLSNELFFVGQKKYLCNNFDFSFLEKNKITKKLKIFSFFIDKKSKIV